MTAGIALLLPPRRDPGPVLDAAGEDELAPPGSRPSRVPAP